MSEPTPGDALQTLLLAERTPPSVGGREAVLAEFLRHLPSSRTRLLAPGIAGALSFDRSVAVPVRRRTRFCPAPLVPLLRRKHFEWNARRFQPDLVVGFGLKIEGPRALAYKQETGTPFLLHLDGPELVEARREIRKGTERGARIQEILDESEAIITCTEPCRLDAYRNGVLPHHLHIVPIGVDLERFRPGERDADLAGRLRVGRGAVMVTVAHTGASDDLGTVLRAFAGARTQRRGSALVVIGAVDERPWKKELAKLRVDRAVRFTGAVPPSSMPDYLRLGDVYMTASREDRDKDIVHGPDVSLVEALACGLPVVATRTPMTEALTDEGDAGVLVESGAHAKMAHAVVDLLGDDERRTELGAAARERAETVHDARETARGLREFLEVVYFRRLRRGTLPVEAPSAEGSARPAA
jgi:phosphatidyl-myo-inositol dimannoside synthase